MMKTSNDLRIGQHHNIKVEKLPNGQFKASEMNLGHVVAPVVADRQDTAIGLLTDKLHEYDMTGKAQE